MGLFEEIENQTGATFSEDRVYRYQLWRIWDKGKSYLNVIGLNPSTADETKDDPTIRRCLGFAKSWGHGGLYMTNLFAFRATKPADMKKQSDPIGPDNDKWLVETASNAGLVVAAWGANGDGNWGKPDGKWRQRDAQVERMIEKLHVFRLTPKGGMPEHPLYLPGDLKPKLIQAARVERADQILADHVSRLKDKIKGIADETDNPGLAGELNALLSRE